MSKPARTAIVLFFLALAVRVALGAWTGMSGPPVEDERGYTLLAQSVAQGRGFELPVPDSDALPRTSFRAPVVPLLYAPLAALGGGVRAFRTLTILIGALGSPLLYFAARKSALGERAVWAAAAYALWPPAVYESVRVFCEPSSQALLVGALALLVAAPVPAAAGGGVLAALAVLARPAALVPAALVLFAAGSRRRATAFALAFVVVLAPWIIRNWDLHGRPLLTTNSGVTLVGGNSDVVAAAEHPGKWAPPERVYAGRADPPDLGMWGWSALGEEASDRRFSSDAVRWVAEDPVRAARLGFWKLVRLVDPDPRSEKDDAGAKSIAGWLTFAPVLVLACIGALRGERMWWMLVAGTALTALVFYGDTRMRTCADPALLVFAAYGVVCVTRRLRGRGVD